MNDYFRQTDRDQLYKKAFDKYGSISQYTVAIEEMAELTKEIVKYVFKDGGNLNELLEEIADVEIMVEQLKLLTNSTHLIGAMKKIKLERLEVKIKKK